MTVQCANADAEQYVPYIVGCSDSVLGRVQNPASVSPPGVAPGPSWRT